MNYFVEDWKGFFQDPKGTFKRISTYDSLVYPGVLLFICGVIMGVKRYLAAIATLGNLLPKEQTPFAWALKDAECIMALVYPLFIVGFWFVCSFLVNEVAEKLGALKGEFHEILMASGYLSYPLLAYLIISFPLFYLGKVKGIAFLNGLDAILGFVFLIWLFYLADQIVETFCEIPMVNACIAILITLAAVLFMYYILIEFFVKHFLAESLQGKYFR